MEPGHKIRPFNYFKDSDVLLTTKCSVDWKTSNSLVINGNSGQQRCSEVRRLIKQAGSGQNRRRFSYIDFHVGVSLFSSKSNYSEAKPHKTPGIPLYSVKLLISISQDRINYFLKKTLQDCSQNTDTMPVHLLLILTNGGMKK